MTVDFENKIPIRVSITEVKTGETRSFDYDGWLDDEGKFFDYIWDEGNYACDCNRALFFARAIGEEDPNRECGDDAYVVKITDPSGLVLYEEDQ